jgi:hypothetical protein
MNALIPFSFEEVRLKEACWIEGKPYFTRRAIGEWLEVKHPDRYVHKIVERNPHIMQFSSLVKLTSELDTGKGTKYEREQEIRVYDPIGLQLIINKSNQPKAVAFQVAVAHLVVAYMKGELIPVSPIEIKLKELVNLRPQSRRRAEAVRRVAGEEGLSTRTIYEYIQKLEHNEPIKKTRKTMTYKGYSSKYEGIYQAVIEHIKTHPKEHIAKAFDIYAVPHSTGYDWLKRAGYHG